jgi:hypothetical protein
MDSAEGLLERLEVALNEADAVGVRTGPTPGTVDVLLHVLALPIEGPVNPDLRRVLRLSGVGDVAFLLRRDTPDGYGPTLSLETLDAVEAFFESLSHQDAMYGWRFFDEPSLTKNWPSDVSLRMTLGGSSGHIFYWFTECRCGTGDEAEGYMFEGTIAFDQLRVFLADGAEVDPEDFAKAGERWWEGFHHGDPRVGGDAQQETATQAPRWRGAGGTSVLGAF